MCWTPKKGLSVSVTWLAILTKEAELSKHQSIFHQLPISAGQSEQEGSKEQLRTGLISFSHLFSPGLGMTERGRLSRREGPCAPASVGSALLQHGAISIPEIPLYRFLQTGWLQRPLLGEGSQTPFTAKGTRWFQHLLICLAPGNTERWAWSIKPSMVSIISSFSPYVLPLQSGSAGILTTGCFLLI